LFGTRLSIAKLFLLNGADTVSCVVSSLRQMIQRIRASARLATRSSRVYLDYGVYGVFRDVPELARNYGDSALNYLSVRPRGRLQLYQPRLRPAGLRRVAGLLDRERARRRATAHPAGATVYSTPSACTASRSPRAVRRDGAASLLTQQVPNSGTRLSDWLHREAHDSGP
jgi:hypothetical protein